MSEPKSSVAVIDEARKMTYREQQNVKAAIRANTVLLKAQIAEREAELVAGLDQEIRKLQAEAEKEANKVRTEIERATQAYNERVRTICDKYPEVFVTGSWERPNRVNPPTFYRNSNSDRHRRVQAARARVNAQVAFARTEVQRQETQQLIGLADANVHSSTGRELLQHLPTIDDLFRPSAGMLEAAINTDEVTT